MAYSFERHESVAVGVSRIIGELTWIVAHQLRPDHPEYPHWVHNTRTTYKRIRSLLRLVRDSLGQGCFITERDRIREAAGRLSLLRDAEVLVLTAETLGIQFPEHAEMISELQLWLLRRYQRIAQVDINVQQLLLVTANEMDDLILRSANWTLPDDFAEPVQNFARCYRQGRKEFARAFEVADDEGFHEWRKRVKNHWYHCRLFELVWLPAMMWRMSELKELSDALGEDHDLAVLGLVLAEEADAPSCSADVEALIAARQRQLRTRAKELGERIFAPEPEALATELQVCLQRW